MVKNYTGDVLNFNMAAELAKEGSPLERVEAIAHRVNER